MLEEIVNFKKRSIEIIHPKKEREEKRLKINEHRSSDWKMTEKELQLLRPNLSSESGQNLKKKFWNYGKLTKGI